MTVGVFGGIHVSWLSVLNLFGVSGIHSQAVFEEASLTWVTVSSSSDTTIVVYRRPFYNAQMSLEAKLLLDGIFRESDLISK